LETLQHQCRWFDQKVSGLAEKGHQLRPVSNKGGGEMANLQIKGIDDGLYRQIKQMASMENRSIGQQVLFLVKTYMVKKRIVSESRSPAQVLLDLSGAWDDHRSAEQIVSDIKQARKGSKRLENGF
jgi:hypothetical protein